MTFITLNLALLMVICALIILLDKKHETHSYPSENKVLMSREDVVQETEASWPDKVEYLVCLLSLVLTVPFSFTQLQAIFIFY